MKKKYILGIFSLVISLSVAFSQDIDTFELDKYQWRKEKTGELVFLKPARKNNSEKWFKIICHHSKNEFVTFKIFNYNDDIEINKLPFYGFEKMFSYEKLTANKGIEGNYRGKKEFEIDYFEVKEVDKKDFIYKIDLPDLTCGEHLLYLENRELRSDSTFGVWKNFFFDELIKVDRSEKFYLEHDFQNKLDDRFSVIISDYDDVYKKLTIVTENGSYDIFPSEFYICEGDPCFLSEEILIYESNNLNSKSELLAYPRYSINEGIVLKKIQEWILDGGRISMWFQIKFPDSRIGWVTGQSLYKKFK